jgi:hypothetical protein
MALAVKSSSSVAAGVRHIAGVKPGEAQLIMFLLIAPLSVSVQGTSQHSSSSHTPSEHQ